MGNELNAVEKCLGIDKETRYEQALQDIANFCPSNCDPQVPDDPYIQIARFAKTTARKVLEDCAHPTKQDDSRRC